MGKNDYITVKEVQSKEDQSVFLKLPLSIYSGTTPWVAPLSMDVKKIFLNNYPFRKHSEMKFFVAFSNSIPVGRIAAIIDYDFISKWQQRIGHFGFFECINDNGVAKALIQSAERFLTDNKITAIYGPLNPSTNYTCGLLVNAFELSPYLDMTYNPPYYINMIEQLGYKKKCDLNAYIYRAETKMQTRMDVIGNYIAQKNNIKIRPINLKHFADELKILREIYNDAWSDNFGFVPVSDEEFAFICGQMKDIAIPDLILIAYINNQPAGFIAAIPDYNVFLKKLRGKLGFKGLYYFLFKRNTIKSTRVITFGLKKPFRKKGVDVCLMHHLLTNARKLKFTEAEFSWILENNVQMIREIENFGGKHYKTYRLYEKTLTGKDGD